jgi:hypothetical protein
MINAFAYTHSFHKGNSKEIISELQSHGFTGINLALNYHASRDFLLRQGPRLEYLRDGFHYYLPNLNYYPQGGLVPHKEDHLGDDSLLRSVISSADEMDFEINAWAVYLHNSAVGFKHPYSTVTNVYDNHFLSELCPSNPGVRAYVLGLSKDLCSRGIKTLGIESLRFHGLRHGEHHERFFLDMSPVTEFLLSLCFCESCASKYDNAGGDSATLKSKVMKALEVFLADSDPWMGVTLSKENLAEILGPEILDYLLMREDSVTSLYWEIKPIAKEFKVRTKFFDPSSLLDETSSTPLDVSWIAGHNYEEMNKAVDIFQPVFYRESPDEIEKLAAHYRGKLTGPIGASLTPMYPFNKNEDDLVEKVRRLRKCGISDFDFYLLDTMRQRDLGWIDAALR